MKKKTCPECLSEYTERSGDRYRHFDQRTGAVTWCKYKRHKKGCPAIQAWDIERACTC